MVQALDDGHRRARMDFPDQIDEDDIELFMNECRLAGYEVEDYISNKPAMEYRVFGDEVELLGLRSRQVYWYGWHPGDKVYRRYP